MDNVQDFGQRHLFLKFHTELSTTITKENSKIQESKSYLYTLIGTWNLIQIWVNVLNTTSTSIQTQYNTHHRTLMKILRLTLKVWLIKRKDTTSWITNGKEKGKLPLSMRESPNLQYHQAILTSFLSRTSKQCPKHLTCNPQRKNQEELNPGK
jgi:hypothetical protein